MNPRTLPEPVSATASAFDATSESRAAGCGAAEADWSNANNPAVFSNDRRSMDIVDFLSGLEFNTKKSEKNHLLEGAWHSRQLSRT
jgi:hypothetical protein